MRVAALYDIHANLPALEAVLDDVRREGVDLIVVGGDVVLGPLPRETLACLRDLGVPLRFVSGNCDAAVVAQMNGEPVTTVPEQAQEAVRWVASRLDDQQRQLLAGWPKTLSVQVDGVGKVLFCHATPRDDNEIFTVGTAEDRLASVFGDVDAAVVVCGHTHMQFDRPVGKVRVVNAGSVGMPFGRTGAFWLLLGPDVQLRRTALDLSKVAEAIRRTDYPQAREFADHYVLEPPPEDKVLEAFAKAELRP